ncbi:glutathione S-transferase [Novosphingobium sp.]|uniref:glutathione S-transferase family protein n=1 Tax=Novosphingobium sp. TaxID=1874826 RepID=UPI001EC5D563|nr:glutathione S-transferase [Novosphingobium sp.]MBK6800624.1 glutathione S-transferase [Novosphingobium sp.]MBK9011180.1 glutathione S-transferase [Novosphingobium sp.]
MKFYTSVGPNPRVVKLFMAEKGITLPEVEIDLRGGENRREPYASQVNPAGQTPALELDDGSFLTEITAICEYLDERFPEPPLVGTTAEERARTRMWTRRVDLKICEPLTNGFRFAEGLPLFEPRMRCLPEAAPGLKAVAQDGIKWLDGLLGDRPFIAGERITLADILLYAFLEFGGAVGQPLDPANANVQRWFTAMQARPSVASA